MLSVIQIHVVLMYGAQGSPPYLISDPEDFGAAGIRNDSDTISGHLGGDYAMQKQVVRR